MTTAQPTTTVPYEDEETIVEPGFVNPEEFQRLINEGIFPEPMRVIAEPLDETNEHLPGTLKLSPSGQLLKQYITWEGFGDHHIEVYDNWIFRSSQYNVCGRILELKDGRIIYFENLKVLQPRYTREGTINA